MIKLFRIDERLIHGQIAIKWSRHTGVDSIVVANDHAAENVNSPADALKMVRAVKGIPFVNIGNYGRVAPKKPGRERNRYDNNLYCDEDEVAQFKELMGCGLDCIYQTTPE